MAGCCGDRKKQKSRLDALGANKRRSTSQGSFNNYEDYRKHILDQYKKGKK